MCTRVQVTPVCATEARGEELRRERAIAGAVAHVHYATRTVCAPCVLAAGRAPAARRSLGTTRRAAETRLAVVHIGPLLAALRDLQRPHHQRPRGRRVLAQHQRYCSTRPSSRTGCASRQRGLHASGPPAARSARHLHSEGLSERYSRDHCVHRATRSTARTQYIELLMICPCSLT